MEPFQADAFSASESLLQERIRNGPENVVFILEHVRPLSLGAFQDPFRLRTKNFICEGAAMFDANAKLCLAPFVQAGLRYFELF